MRAAGGVELGRRLTAHRLHRNSWGTIICAFWSLVVRATLTDHTLLGVMAQGHEGLRVGWRGSQTYSGGLDPRGNGRLTDFRATYAMPQKLDEVVSVRARHIILQAKDATLVRSTKRYIPSM
jgi:hypothetical protein